MARNVLAFPNRVDSTRHVATFSGGSWEADLPLTNLRDPRLAYVARSTDTTEASTHFDVDLQVERDILVVAIPGGNVSRDGRVRLTAASDAGFASVVAAVDWADWWPVVYEFGALPWGSPSFWDGKIDAEAAEGYEMPWHFVFSTPVQARYWRIEISDVGNLDGYVELPRLVLAPGCQPSRNYGHGARMGWADDSTVERSLGGAVFVAPQPRYRKFDLTWPYLPRGEALAWVMDMQRQLGVSGQAYYVENPDDVTNRHRLSMLCRLRQLDPLDFVPALRASAALALEEVIA